QAGHDDRAVAELERAIQGLARIGASGYCAEAQKELRRVGRSVRSRAAGAATGTGAVSERTASQHHLAVLTPGERAVVALVADGLTNPEIAEQLYLSRHTVKRHLANAMRKLNVSSRRQLRASTSRSPSPGAPDSEPGTVRDADPGP
ncbi:MAG: helix-turn-helix transcriptional regulator, partial [Acidimicrobiales bacterium]